jgi:hypothetical protein
MAKRPERPPPRQEKQRRDSGEQSGSTGRNPGTGDTRDDGANTGQDSYGMNDAGPRAANDDRINRDSAKPGSTAPRSR